MAFILQILGVVFLILILVILVLIVLIRSSSPRIARGPIWVHPLVYEALDRPPKIMLIQETMISWIDSQRVTSTAETLTMLGYRDAGLYTSEDPHDTKLWAFANPGESAFAVIHENRLEGVWMDYITYYRDGKSITFTNAPFGSELEWSPRHPRVYLDKLNPGELRARFQKERPRKAMKSVIAADFADLYERAYADEMAWRNARGGLSEHEIRAYASRLDVELSEKEIEETRKSLSWQALIGLEAVLLERFLKSTSMSAAEWEQSREHILFVHNRLTPDHLVDRIEEVSDLAAGELADILLDNGNPRRSFAAFNRSLPLDLRFEKIGEVRTPVVADVYRYTAFR